MTPTDKAELRRETAARLNKPFMDALDYLAKCRQGLHSLDPKEFGTSWSRKQLFISAKSWVTEARRAKYSIEAASPDSQNARSAA